MSSGAGDQGVTLSPSSSFSLLNTTAIPAMYGAELKMMLVIAAVTAVTPSCQNQHKGCDD